MQTTDWSRPPPTIDDHSPTWNAIAGHVKDRLVEISEDLAAERDATAAAELRGRYQALKEVLELGSEPRLAVVLDPKRPAG